MFFFIKDFSPIYFFEQSHQLFQGTLFQKLLKIRYTKYLCMPQTYKIMKTLSVNQEMLPIA